MKQSLKSILISGLLLLAIQVLAQQPTSSLQEIDKVYEEGEKLQDRGEENLAFPKLQQAKEAYLAMGAVVPYLTHACYRIGLIHFNRQDFPQAIESYKEYIFFTEKLNTDKDSIFVEPLLVIGTAFINLNEYDSAYAYYKTAESILDRYPVMPLSQKLRFHNEAGYLFYLFGNYVQSINHWEKALKILDYEALSKDQQDEDATSWFIFLSNNIAGSLDKLGQHQQALKKLHSVIKYGSLSNTVYQHIASLYLQTEKPDSALIYLSKIKVKDISISAKADYYNSLGSAYTQTGKFTEALSHFDKAMQISLTGFGNKNDWIAMAYAGKGRVYELQSNFPQALAHYQLAVQALHFTFNSTDIYQNPADLNNAASPLLLFKILQQKAHILKQYFTQTRRSADLEAALSTYQRAFQLAGRIRKSYDSDEAKLFFTNIVSPVYEAAIETAYQLFSQTYHNKYLDAAFALAEESKAAVLAESLRELKIRQVPGISESLLRKESDLKRNISALNIKLVEETDSTRKELYRTRLRDHEIELAKTLKEFENNKQYYQLKYDTSTVQLSQMQREMDKKTALIEYFAGKKHLYVFVITQKSVLVKQLPFTNTYQQDWQTLYQALYEAKSGSRYKGDVPAHQLYQQLLAPVASLLEGKQRLVIIPDKELSYLPFEALVTDESTNRYVIQDYIVSYAYSGKFLQNASQEGSSGQKINLLAMAPFVTDNSYGKSLLRGDVLNPLYASHEEVKQIGGQVYLAKEATKNQFLEQAGRYDIIHLATHAKADNQDPLHSFIAFYPQEDTVNSYRLYAQELYNLHLDKLKLIVLSACETSSGKLIQGEGVMSLARAFAYAGCPSIVTTLWKAEDKTTADISVRMHEYFKEGKSKDEALRLAKLAYLNSQTHASRRSPVYWANFIFIGDHAPVYTDYTYIWLIFSGVIASSLAVWFYIKKRSLPNKYVTKKA